jgi:hypothetical protein
MLPAAPRPAFQFSAQDLSPMELSIQVQIDAAGQPDMRTLRVTGRGAAEHRPAIEEWILRARFQPASRNGEPVPGLFTTALRSRVEVRRR